MRDFIKYIILEEYPAVFDMEIKRGRHVGANSVKMEIMPKSGLIGKRISGQF